MAGPLFITKPVMLSFKLKRMRTNNADPDFVSQDFAMLDLVIIIFNHPYFIKFSYTFFNCFHPA